MVCGSLKIYTWAGFRKTNQVTYLPTSLLYVDISRKEQTKKCISKNLLPSWGFRGLFPAKFEIAPKKILMPIVRNQPDCHLVGLMISRESAQMWTCSDCLAAIKVARNEVKNASFAQRSAHRDSRIWRPELIEPVAERKQRARGRRPTFKSAYPDPQILPQCNISSNYPL